MNVCQSRSARVLWCIYHLVAAGQCLYGCTVQRFLRLVALSFYYDSHSHSLRSLAAWAVAWLPWGRPIYNCSCAAALESPGNALLGKDAGLIAGAGALGVPLAAELLVPVDVVVDFSVPKAAELILETCRQEQAAAGPGHDRLLAPADRADPAAAKDIPLLWSPSMSMAVNLAMKLCELAGKALADKDADVEILERHHRFKEDSPSGTALKFGEIIARQMGQTRVMAAAAGR